MKEITFSVPSGSFPAGVGDHVRMSIKGIVGLDMIDVLVLAVLDGCGAADQVTVRYDETLLPGVLISLTRCNIEGFQKLCEWCDISRCSEVFGPVSEVVDGTWHVAFMPSNFRLDQVKLFSFAPTDNPIKFNILVNGEPLLPYPFTFDGNPLAINRIAFDSAFSDGQIDANSEITIEISEAPGVYDPAWMGLTVCLLGQWLP